MNSDKLDVINIYEEDHNSYVNSSVIFKDEDSVLTASNDPKLLVWSLSSVSIIKKLFNHRGAVLALEHIYNKDLLASGGRDRSIKTWKIEYSKTAEDSKLKLSKITLDINIENAFSTDVTALKGISSNENNLLAGAANGDIKLFNIIDGSTIKKFKSHNGFVFKFLVIDYQNREVDEILKKKKKCSWEVKRSRH